jgi:hypothetical protein
MHAVSREWSEREEGEEGGEAMAMAMRREVLTGSGTEQFHRPAESAAVAGAAKTTGCRTVRAFRRY